MPIETLDDIINEIMDRLGIYGGHDHDTDDSGVTCHCRCCETSSLTDRLRAAFDVEQRLARQNVKVAEQTPTNSDYAAALRVRKEFIRFINDNGNIANYDDWVTERLNAGK